MAHLGTVVAFGILLATAPVSAAKPGTAASPAENAAQSAAAKPAGTKYCIRMEGFTGSRTSKTECKTKAEWTREGVDVDKLTH